MGKFGPSAALGSPAMPGPQPVNLGALAQMGSDQKPGLLAKIFGPQGSSSRYDAAMALLQNAQQSAQGAGSPLLSFLTPIAAAMIGGKATNDRNTAKAREVSAMTESLLGPRGNSPEAQNAISILENPDAPDYLKAIAKTQFGALTAPAPRVRAHAPAPSSAAPGTEKAVRLYGEAYEDPPGSGQWFKTDAYGRRHQIERGQGGGAAPGQPGGGSVQPGGALIDGYSIQEVQ